MRKVRKNRPLFCESLEDRTVLSGPDVLMGGFIQTLPVQDAQAVAKAVATFEKAYNNDVQTILVPKGATTPNRSGFDNQVKLDLATLNSSIDTAIANITHTANATLVSTITTDLVGPSTTTTTSLEDTLSAITTPTSTTGSSVRSFISKADHAIDQAGYQVTKLVSSATAPTGTITSDAAKTLFQAVNSAYQTFSQGYASATSATATSPVTSRSAFNAAVGTLLTNLNASIATALGKVGLPDSNQSTLTTTVSNDLTGTPASGTSLQAQLAALTSPTSARGFSMLIFKAQSYWTIGGSQFQVSKDIVSAINAYNLSLTA